MNGIFLQVMLFLSILIKIKTEKGIFNRDSKRNLDHNLRKVQETEHVFQFSNEYFNSFLPETIEYINVTGLLNDSTQPNQTLGGKEKLRARTKEPQQIDPSKSYLIDIDYNLDLSNFSFGYLLFKNNDTDEPIGEDPDYINFDSIPTKQNRMYISGEQSNSNNFLYFNFKKNDGSNFTQNDRDTLEHGLINGKLRIIEIKMEQKIIVNQESDITNHSWQPFKGQELGGKAETRRRNKNPIQLKTNNLNKIFVKDNERLKQFQFGYMAFDEGKTIRETISDKDVGYMSFDEIKQFSRNHDKKTIGKPNTYNKTFVLTLNFKKTNDENFTKEENDNLINELRNNSNFKINSYYNPVLLCGSWPLENTPEVNKRLRISTPIKLEKDKEYRIIVKDPTKLKDYKFNYRAFSNQDLNITDEINENKSYYGFDTCKEDSPQDDVNVFKYINISEKYYYLVINFKGVDNQDLNKDTLVRNLENNFYIDEVEKIAKLKKYKKKVMVYQLVA